MAHKRVLKGDGNMKQELQQLRAMTTGLVVGGLAGVIVGLLLAPAAGNETRQRLQEQAFSVRDDAMQAVGQARAKAEALQGSGRELIEDNQRRITRTVEAARDGAVSAWQAADPVKPSQSQIKETIPEYKMIRP
jgi:gas vesicle protein